MMWFDSLFCYMVMFIAKPARTLMPFCIYILCVLNYSYNRKNACRLKVAQIEAICKHRKIIK